MMGSRKRNKEQPNAVTGDDSASDAVRARNRDTFRRKLESGELVIEFESEWQGQSLH